MAIVKHSSSKNARYEDVLEYYTCRHREDSRTGYYAPILDKYGLMQPRSDSAGAVGVRLPPYQPVLQQKQQAQRPQEPRIYPQSSGGGSG